MVTKNEMATSRAWLLSWNPTRWDWIDYEDACEDTKYGETYPIDWACISKQPAIGDEIFLIKLGPEPRGIIGHGYVTEESHTAGHFDWEKEEKGDQSKYIGVEFNRILDYNSEPILLQSDLKVQFPNQQWSPQASGIEIKKEVAPDVINLWSDFTESEIENDSIDINDETDDEMYYYDKNMILYGPPGTGKTYSTAIYAVAICDQKDIEEVKKWDYEAVLERYRELLAAGRIAFTTFHQSYCYEEFIEGIKPVLNGGSDVGYRIEDGIFKAFCKKATALPNNNYVFIIDEINRGNISKILGELITLLEDTKREGMDEAMSALLPYSKESFSVPLNVYILGTMNTADRSLALLDTALRRRFQFVEMMPDTTVLRELQADKVEDLDVVAMLDKMNERIALLYDREHMIGHAFFTKLAKSPTVETLGSIFEKSIIPLLQEYFYEDYQKIQLVLGDTGKADEFKFILDEDVRIKTVFKGNVDDAIDFSEKKYTINKSALSNLESYKQII